MPTITFTLSDFGLASLASKLPTVKFVPSGAGVAGDRLFTSTPVTAVMVGDVGTVTLAATDGVVPTVWYTVQIEHLQPGGEYTHFDLLDVKLFIPEDYEGPISGLPGTPLSPYTVLVSLDTPPTGYKGWWLYSPAEGQDMPLDDPQIGGLRMVDGNGTYTTVTNLRGPAANISEATSEVVPADQPAEVIVTGLDQDRSFHFKVPRGLDGETVLDNDAAMAQRLLAIDTATHKAALSAASTMIRLDGERLLWVGDSITLLGTTLTQGQSYTTFAAWQSAGRIREFARTAVSGMRSDQQLAAVEALILAGGPMPTMASILVGTNDLGQGIALSVWQANVIALVDILRKVGCEPVLLTLPPRSGPATPVAPATLNGVWNEWLRTYTAAQNIVLVDIWKVVSDPGTGEWKAGWSNPADGVHPTAVAQKAMGDEWIKVVGPHLKSATFPQLDGNSRDGAREAGLPFTSAGAVPAGWTVTGSATVDVVLDPASPTKYALRLVAANPAVRPDVMTKILASSGDFKTGDVIEVVAKFRVVSGTVAPGFGMRVSVVEYTGAASGTQHSVWLFGQSTPTAQYLVGRYRFTPGASTDEIRATFQYLKDSTGTDSIEARLASLRIYNVTALGLTT